MPKSLAVLTVVMIVSPVIFITKQNEPTYMKNLLIFFLLSFPALCAANQPSIFDNHAWYVDSAHLSVHATQPFQGYDHSLEYVTPDQITGSSDMCAVTAPNTLHCLSGDTVVVNSQNYSATLNNKYIYFDKDHQPTSSPLSGHWHSSNDPHACEITDVIIPYASYSATSFYTVAISGPNRHGETYTFYLGYSKYSHDFYLDITPQGSDYTGYRMYDKDDKLINGMEDISKVVKFISHSIYRDCIFTKI